MSAASLRTYESLSSAAADAPSSLRSIVADCERIPTHPPFAEARALERHRRALVDALGRSADAPLDVSTSALERYIAALLDRATTDTTRLTRRDATTPIGWSVLALVWLLVAYANALLEREYRRRTLARAPLAVRRVLDAHPARSEWLRDAHLVVVGRRVAHYSASELASAVYVVRARLDSLASIDRTLLEYVRALEFRAAALVVATHPATVHDVEQWRVAASSSSSYCASRAFVASSAHWFVTVRRVLANYRLASSPSYFLEAPADDDASVRAYPVEPLRFDDADDAPLRRVEHFVARWAHTYSSDAHVDAWVRLAAPYTVAAGSIAAVHAARTDNERVTWRMALAHEHSSAAADFAAGRKFRTRPLGAFVDAALERRRSNDGRPGAAGDSFFESLAALHTWRVYVRSTLGLVEWAEWFVVMQRDAERYHTRLNAAVDARLPTIVQTLGRFSVLVPASPTTVDPLELERATFALARARTPDGVPLANRRARATLYETRSALEALVLWLAALLAGWRGVVHRGTSLAPLARYLLGVDDGGARLEAPNDARVAGDF